MANFVVTPACLGVMLTAPSGSTPYERAFILGRFRCFYNLNGGNSAPADAADTNYTGVPDFVVGQVQNLLNAHHVYTNIMGLPDFFYEGYLQRQGLSYVDVVFDDIPVQRGLASDKITDFTPDFLRESEYEGLSIILRLHRALPISSLTPAHELFHIFQYACLPLFNMWFMEGLARHGQRWLSDKKLISLPLPQNQLEIEVLLQRWHDSESFWNRLGELCNVEPDETVVVKEAHLENSANPHLAGQRFMSVFFRHTLQQILNMRTDMPTRLLPEDGNWAAVEKRSGANNRYILRAICNAVSELAPQHCPELENFIDLLRKLDRQYNTLQSAPTVQQLLRILQQHSLSSVYLTPNGLLQCDSYDPVTGTLSIPEIIFPAGQLTDADLDSFIVVRHIIGSLSIQNQPDITSLNGLRMIVAVEGNIDIENTGLADLKDVFPVLERIKGHLRIHNNRKLKVITGFNSLVSIDKALEITDHPLLATLEAFCSLWEIKKESLLMRASPMLSIIKGFSVLQYSRGVHLEKLSIGNVDFLSQLFSKNPDFPGSIKLESCRLTNINALSGLRSVRNSLYLHNNILTDLSPLMELTQVGASFSLSGNLLKDLRPLSKLVKVNGMLGLANNKLECLDGLENLCFLKTVKWGIESRTLVIRGNKELRDITAVKNVQTDDRYIIIYCDSIRQYEKRPSCTDPFHSNVLQIHDVQNKRVVPTWQWITKNSHDYSFFRQTTHNKILTYMHDFELDSDTLVISFAGVGGNLGGVFYNRYGLIVNRINTHKIFINDTLNRWYQSGIPGITANIAETIEYISFLKGTNKYRKVVCIGQSAGGYMSLLVGHQIGATDVVAFAPQTFLDQANRTYYGDSRWSQLLKKLPENIPHRYLDLREIYKQPQQNDARIHVHYSMRQALDVKHIEHLGDFPGLLRHPYDSETHEVSIYLDRELNILNNIIIDTIEN